MNEYLEIIVRSLVVYISIILFIRIFGKKELSQLSVIDLVFILLISNSVQNAMVGPGSSLTGGLIAAATLFAVNALLRYITFRSQKARELIKGHAIMLIYNGKPIVENLKKEEITIDELEAASREHGVERLEDVNLAILETDGNISILSNNYQQQTSKKRRQHKIISQKN